MKPTHTAELHKELCEVHTTIGGFWSVDTIQTYFDAVDAASLPLVQDRSPIYACVDFTDFIPQDRATGDAIRDHLLKAQKFGLCRIATIGASALTAMQYKRLSQGIVTQFFENKPDALAWLRADR
ncbi:MAG: hypothetical protein AAGK17_02085 [Pseudomonadota bacterium]